MRSEKINTLSGLLEMAEKEQKSSAVEWWIYAVTTDSLLLARWEAGNGLRENLTTKEGRLLELRIFSEAAEYKAFRGDIGHPLRCRRLEDNADISDAEYFDETQFLDINLKNAVRLPEGGWSVWTTTGGGPYTVPLGKIDNSCIVIRNYLSYYENSGQAYLSDYRLVQLAEKPADRKEGADNVAN